MRHESHHHAAVVTRLHCTIAASTTAPIEESTNQKDMGGGKKNKKEVVEDVEEDPAPAKKKKKKTKKEKVAKAEAPAVAPEEASPQKNLAASLFGGDGGEQKGGALANLFAAPKVSKFTAAKAAADNQIIEAAKKVEAEANEDKPDEDDQDPTGPQKQYIIRPKVSSAQKNAEAEKLKRTVFVGNVPSGCIQKPAPLKKAFLALFPAEQTRLPGSNKDTGPIESIRFRSIAFAEGTKHRRSAVHTKADLGKRSTCNAYIVFRTVEFAEKAVKEGNSQRIDNRVLRCDFATAPGKHEDLTHGDHRKGIFVGNLPFDIEEDQLRRHFDNCGEISNVRVVRDRGSNLGKGIAFVQFTDRDAVALAVEQHESMVGSRKIRVTRLKKEGNSGSKEGKHTRGMPAAKGAPQPVKRARAQMAEDGSGPSGYQGEYQAELGEVSLRKKKKSLPAQLEGIKKKKGKKARDPDKRAARQMRRQVDRKQK